MRIDLAPARNRLETMGWLGLLLVSSIIASSCGLPVGTPIDPVSSPPTSATGDVPLGRLGSGLAFGLSMAGDEVYVMTEQPSGGCGGQQLLARSLRTGSERELYEFGDHVVPLEFDGGKPIPVAAVDGQMVAIATVSCLDGAPRVLVIGDLPGGVDERVLWEPENFTTAEFETSDIGSLKWSPDGETLYITGWRDLAGIDVESEAVVYRDSVMVDVIELHGGVRATFDGTTVAIDGIPVDLPEVPDPSATRWLVAGPDSSSFAITGSPSFLVTVDDDGFLTEEIPIELGSRAVWSADGTKVAGRDGYLSSPSSTVVWDRSAGRRWWFDVEVDHPVAFIGPGTSVIGVNDFYLRNGATFVQIGRYRTGRVPVIERTEGLVDGSTAYLTEYETAVDYQSIFELDGWVWGVSPAGAALRIDAASGELADEQDLLQPTASGIAVGTEAWVFHNDSIGRFDARTGRTVGSIDFGPESRPRGVLAGDDVLVIHKAESASGGTALSVVDPTTLVVEQTFGLWNAFSPSRILVNGEIVWILDMEASGVHRVNRSSGKVDFVYVVRPSSGFSGDVVAVDDQVWVIGNGQAWLVDPESDEVVRTVQLAGVDFGPPGPIPPRPLGGTDGHLWAAATDGLLRLYDLETGTVRHTVPLESRVVGMSITEDRLWVVTIDDRLAEIDPQTGEVLRTVIVRGARHTFGPIEAGGAVWVMGGYGNPVLTRVTFG